MSLGTLPAELVHTIAQYLCARDIAELSAVCQFLNGACRVALLNSLVDEWPTKWECMLATLHPSKVCALLQIVDDTDGSHTAKTCVRACVLGRLDLLQSITLHPKSLPAAFRAAATHGQLDCLKYLSGQLLDYGTINYAFRFAANNGHLHILQWLTDHSVHAIHVNPAEFDNAAFRWAAGNGHLCVVQWLAATFPASVDPGAREGEAFVSAAGAGYLDLLTWLHDQFLPLMGDFMEACFWAALANGHTAVLQWLSSHFPDVIFSHNKSFTALEAFRQAVVNNHLTSLQWVWSHHGALFRHCGSAGEMLQAAAQAGNVELMQWLHGIAGTRWHMCARNKNGGSTNCAGFGPISWLDVRLSYSLAAKSGHVHVLKWLWATHHPFTDSCATGRHWPQCWDAPRAMENAAMRGHVRTLHWLVCTHIHPHTLDHHTNLQYAQWLRRAFCSAVRAGKVKVMQWLASTFPHWVTSDCLTDSDVLEALTCHYTDVLDWLHHNFKLDARAMRRGDADGRLPALHI